jgi:hypothetical protein
MTSYYATLNAIISHKKQKDHEDFGFVLSLRTMLGFLTRGGGGVGAESGRGLRAFTAVEPAAGVDAGAGDVERLKGGEVDAKLELGAGKGRGAGKFCAGVEYALQCAAGLGVRL